ncbi:type I-E CRISPR-associated protein Cas7/Cse4/CasC [Micrococcus luteus]|uniref:type I-E CRISPR-associated protein Cas7/Cse4/CasC n=1 Tax=Micrococcus luteus TaxID=1270 RepID=UPI0010AE1647|nr:type I-E CRISPR-associated protein Cas7/Cse4/CasC [Micrococcus luteus]TKD55445.1 type I-E CRISPR-associated protein Cas7/Cse4/CasC [Micrococcus luteus]
MSLYIDIHALQTLPPNNINRDDTGSPKTAMFGGVPRQRVSSQAWKRAIRRDFANYLEPSELGVRTKRVVEKVAYRVLELQGRPNPDVNDPEDRSALLEAATRVEAVLKSAGLKPEKKKLKKNATEEEQLDVLFSEVSYLLFLSDQQVSRVAQAVVDRPEGPWPKKEAAAMLDEAHSVDVAMFGRMVADVTAYNVDAAVQVAHAIGVSPSEPEFDYFTAVDDVRDAAEEAGAGMIGTVAFTSSTLYRYANVDLDGLVANLGSGEAATRAVGAFVQAFMTSMPTGKQNTFANTTLPDVVIVSVRDDRPVSWVNAFEVPVSGDADGGRRVEAARRLATEAASLDAMYDTTARKTWVMGSGALGGALEGLGASVNRTQLLAELEAELGEVLA